MWAVKGIFHLLYHQKDNDWAKANPDEIQQMYVMTPIYTADGGQPQDTPHEGLISRYAHTQLPG